MKFKMGDKVRKTSGGKWRGTVVGTYSTGLTPEGYAVESSAETGSVQIYPAKALEAWDGEAEGYTAADMATARAEGFRDGQAAAEPAPAQDEREAYSKWRISMEPYGFNGVDAFSAGATWQRTRPAQTEQQPAYVECRECTDCGHVGINDAHQTDATCAMCDWSGPSPVEDQCPDCGKENAMGAACPKCSGRYRILAETHR